MLLIKVNYLLNIGLTNNSEAWRIATDSKPI